MRTTRLMMVALMVGSVALPASADSASPWEFHGGGWGHGVGLSQYGSEGMARDGHSAEEIIDYYYSGAQVKTLTELGAESWLGDEEAIWVGLATNRTTKVFEAVGGPVDVCVRDHGAETCDTPGLALSDGEQVTVTVVDDSDPLACEAKRGEDTVTGECWIDITWAEDPGNTGVITSGIEYARGSLRVRPNDDTSPDGFHVAVSVGLEKYIYGIAETLLHWKVETLKTQAIIARSYGVNKALASADGTGELSQGRKDLCWCHIWSTASDQNYDGWSGALATEGNSTYGDKWRQAVDETAGKVVTHPDVDGGNTIISTFYSSSNGGASETNEDVWGGSPRPYLRSVDDPWSADPDLNPLARWTIYVSDSNLAAYFGWDRVLDATVLQGPPGVLVEFTGVDNDKAVETTLDGRDINRILHKHGYRSDGVRVRVSPYVISVSDPPGFDDIVGHVFEGDVEWALNEGIARGCNPPDNTRYCPGDEVTRGVMAAFLNRHLDLPPAGKDYFTDDDGSIFEDDINRLAAAGITSGCGGTRFCPGNVVDRGQMAAFLVRAFGLTDNGGGDLFDDDDGSIFEHDIDILGTAGITRGCNPPANDRYCPDLPVDRGAMAAFLHRASKS